MTHIQIFGLEEGRMGNNGGLDDIFECKIERKAGYSRWNKTDSAIAQCTLR